jgi:hypothetical protein
MSANQRLSSGPASRFSPLRMLLQPVCRAATAAVAASFLALGADAPPPRVTEAGPHHRVVEVAHMARDVRGESITVTNRFVELADGLNRFDAEAGGWVPAQAVWEMTSSGDYVARHTANQAIVAPDLAEPTGPVQMLGRDGVLLRWRLIGLALVDADSGNSVLLAEARSCLATWVDAQTLLWSEGFDSLSADVRLTLRLSGLEHDVVLRERIPPELVADLGLDPSATRLLILTEFIDPPPATTERRWTATDPRNPARTNIDDEVVFGRLRIGSGKAFGENAPEGRSIAVRKSWELLSGRRFLVEQMDYVALGPLFENLPEPTGAHVQAIKTRAARTAALTPPRRDWRASLRLPPADEPRQARADVPGFRDGSLRLPERSVASAWTPASAHPPGTEIGRRQSGGVGLVADFQVLEPSATNFTFQGDTTYVVTNTVNL